MENTLTESQTKTAQSCYNMYNKWAEVSKPEKKTVAHYLKACTEGYPRGTKINPSLLKSRLKGLQNFAAIEPDKIKLDDKTLKVCTNVIETYKATLSKSDDQD